MLAVAVGVAVVVVVVLVVVVVAAVVIVAALVLVATVSLLIAPCYYRYRLQQGRGRNIFDISMSSCVRKALQN